MKSFITLYPYSKNIHLVKDVGIIPWMFSILGNFRSELVTCELDYYCYLNKETPGLTISFLPKTDINISEKVFSVCKQYLVTNAQTIDILNLYDISSSIVKLARLYKRYNPKGKLYIKLDRGFNYPISKNPFKRLRERFLELSLTKHADLISAESTDSCAFFKKHTFLRPEYIPNGYSKKIDFLPELKNNTILFVGDVSIDPKRIDLVLDAFSTICETTNNLDWKLKLIGPVKEDFQVFWHHFCLDHSEIVSRIEIAGPQYDRELLDEEYQKASVFVLASDHESFGIVLPEAIRAGCVPVVSSGIASANDITDLCRVGFIFERGSAQSLASALACAMEKAGDTIFLRQIVEHSESFYWPTICKKIKNLLGEP